MPADRKGDRPGVFFRVTKLGKYQKLDDGHTWMRLHMGIFQDSKIHDLPVGEQVGWIGLMIFAKNEKNDRLPWRPKMILEVVGLKGHAVVNLEKFKELGLIEIVEDVQVEAPVVAPKPERKKREPVVLTWVQEAVRAWEKRFGAGSGSRMFGRIGVALKPLVEAHGEETVLAAFQRFLDPSANPTEARFLTPEVFTSKYATWVGSAAAAGPPLPQDTVIRRREVKVG